MSVVVVLDLVSTPDAHVLVPVSVHLVSPMVLLLDEIAVVLDPFLIAFFAIATRTVVANVVFAAETLSVAAVVSGPAVWVHHVWSALIGIVSSNSHQHLSHFSLCG